MVTVERLKELLNYNPETGVFTWKVKRKGTRGVGSVAGKTDRDGYIRITIDYRLYAAHRLAWLWVHGQYPTLSLDHKDTNRANNAIENLREATQRQNVANSRMKYTNREGLKGVRFRAPINRFVARIRVNGKVVSLGQHKTAEAAHRAYCDAAVKYFGEFARFK